MTTGTNPTVPAALEARVAEVHRRATIILLAILISIVLYVAIALVLANTRQPKPTGLSQNAFLGFFATAAFLAFGSIFYRRTQMRRIRLEIVAGLRGIDGLLKHFLQVTIVTVALADLIGLLALVISFFGALGNDSLKLGVVAIGIAIFAYPRRQSWQQAAAYFANIPGID